jgi:hypothetical protein
MYLSPLASYMFRLSHPHYVIFSVLLILPHFYVQILSSLSCVKTHISVVPLRCETEFQTYKDQTHTHEGVSRSFRTDSIAKYTLTLINTRWETTQRVMAANLIRLTHKIAMQPHLVAESCTICSSRSRRPVRKLLVTPLYLHTLCYITDIFLSGDLLCVL